MQNELHCFRTILNHVSGLSVTLMVDKVFTQDSFFYNVMPKNRDGPYFF